MTTEEGNKLIAEFMGAKSTMVDHTKGNEEYLKSIGKTEWFIETWSKPDGLPESVGWGIYQLGKFQYHFSWEWLMPVVEKIETLFNDGIDVNILSDGTIIEQYRDSNDTQLHSPVELVRMTRAEIGYDSKIEHTWLAVVEFIKWYNRQHK